MMLHRHFEQKKREDEAPQAAPEAPAKEPAEAPKRRGRHKKPN